MSQWTERRERLYSKLLAIRGSTTHRTGGRTTRVLPYDQWPRRIRLLAKLRKPWDAGAGDTLARLIPAGETFKAAFKRLTGRDCGCSARQATMNAMYPYTQLEA